VSGIKCGFLVLLLNFKQSNVRLKSKRGIIDGL
jgi:hypothetical protein